MKRRLQCLLIAAATLSASSITFALSDTPARSVSLDQNIDQATLHRFYFTDQGTRLIPAAWLDALKDADGDRIMDPEALSALGFLYDGVKDDAKNPYGWPIGFTVSDPARTGGIPIAGLSCAACHTGQIEYRGTSVRIDGGQSMIDLAGFAGRVLGAVSALAHDKARFVEFRNDAVKSGYPADRIDRDLEEAVEAFKSLGGGPSFYELHTVGAGRGRYDAVQGISNQVFGGDLGVPSNSQPLDAPVTYPQLWDIWRLSWLQFNGFLPPNSTSRNIGEALGVRARTNIIDPHTGELNPEPLRWKTSVQLDNLLWMEKTLERLTAPTWPTEVLGPIDEAKAAKGRDLFVDHCAGCHQIRETPDGLWDVVVVPLSKIGTDPNQATHWAGRTYDASKLGMSKNATAVELDVAINAIRRQLYADFNTPKEEQEADVQFHAPCGYKARPLIGVWATPPFLHNGSVRTVFDLLSDTRPARFRFGSREYDPAHLGYTEDDAPGSMMLETSIAGNLNTGHWWTDDTQRAGRIGPKLSDDDKYALIEYLKSANYENYPRTKVDKGRGLPCEDDKDWAKRAAAP
ncbi:di-heme-cytochrome C peroxidase [Mesorhizobium sp. WSM4935]|uniref:di-heme-cytochrome C peroxidase n=1 Tax=Mesorhizobium sp. WSM4935 TaxID=3038547 RepID=UPI00241559B9|nr:di-heme-cytochrome C peroxidase [Mesorhizobium sp. WSM4935]MDG4874099.1 di-heme-cytochrome C peroxidase [Mesorhizobium sp. WSM4935]